jgi:hypothetical protein
MTRKTLAETFGAMNTEDIVKELVMAVGGRSTALTREIEARLYHAEEILEELEDQIWVNSPANKPH